MAMKESIRRVFSATGIIGLLVFSIITLQQLSVVCESGQLNCMTAAVTFGVLSESTQPSIPLELNHAAPTTIINLADTPSMAAFILTLIQVTSVYLILLSVVALVVLELFELRYLRRLVTAKSV
jgi:hypothetical protein